MSGFELGDAIPPISAELEGDSEELGETDDMLWQTLEPTPNL